ncbi:MAG: TolC family protein [Kofleriaceae bacterium]
MKYVTQNRRPRPWLAGALGLLTLVTAGERALAQPTTRDASDSDDAQPGLATYEQQALAQNLTLRVREVGQKQRAAERSAAKSGYFPTVDLGARYTHFLFGGLDLGAFINPAYGALNQVLGEERFPTDLTVRLPLAFEAKVELRQPLYVPAIGVAARLASLGYQAGEVELELARREVVAGVRAAYLHHARAAQVGALLRGTRALLEENLRVSRQLVSASKQTSDVVFRATAELAAHDQLILQVADAQRGAARALNQLRGAGLEEDVEAPSALAVPAEMPASLESLLERARAARTELRLLGVGRSVAQAERDLIKTGSLPTVAMAAEYGLQSGDLSPTLDDDYATISVVASWNLFSGLRDSRRRRAKDLELSAVEVRRRQLLDQIELEVRNAYGSAEVARTAVAAAAERVKSAQSVYDIVEKKYSVGALPQIELIAARTTLLQARTDEITASTDFHLRLVELERVTEFKGTLR